ncbi:adenylyltransferase/cytidyltransferase family protein [Pseudomonas nitroreducens]|uniref:adenylyltransferase/cytidyltransferase family protein n=1 Tax=Pseudomonas nitroreducens TaxID=46680 RepID=UPI002FE36FDC
MNKTIITFGTFDVFHVGHLNLLERASRLGQQLVVGVSTDALNFSKKGRYPVYAQEERMRIIGSLRCVDEVFLEQSLEDKADYVREYSADILVMGDDWTGCFDWLAPWCEIIYLPRTPSISTTEVIERIRS